MYGRLIILSIALVQKLKIKSLEVRLFEPLQKIAAALCLNDKTKTESACIVIGLNMSTVSATFLYKECNSSPRAFAF